MTSQKDRALSGAEYLKYFEATDLKNVGSKLFSYLISHGEECRLDISQVAKLLQTFSGEDELDSVKVLRFVKSSREKFRVKTVEGKEFVEARTSIKICDGFQEGICRTEDCKRLHICRFFLEDNCSFGNECKRPHGFDITQTRALLAQHNLDNLPTDALKILFSKVLNEKKIKYASSSSGPSVCKFYNKGECKNGDKCEFLHVCEHYVDGDCKFMLRCKRYHDFESTHARKILALHNMEGVRDKNDILSVLQSKRVVSVVQESSDNHAFLSKLAQCAAQLEENSSIPASTSLQSVAADCSDEKLVICGFNLRGKCSYGNKCNALHTVLPYQWQYNDQIRWKNFHENDNREIEKKFCDEEVDKVFLNPVGLGWLNIDLVEMMGRKFFDEKTFKLRRLSTVSSVLAASGHVFRTTWKWYWKDEHDKWRCYDTCKAYATSEDIEKHFQSDEKTLTFSAGSNSYTLHFDDVNNLYQQNNVYGTKRDVRRRPANYVDEKNMKQILEKFKQNRQRAGFINGNPLYPVPSSWSPIDPAEEFKVVDLDEVSHSEEFLKVKAQFMTTMASFKVKCIKRVQNPGLWEDYERQKSKIMKKNSGQSPEERWLFHGTSREIMDPICQQGFDWRLSGTKHGAVYGMGSYFAIEASYSHKYSLRPLQGCWTVLLAKVIVGSYVKGSHGTQRPPAKDPSNSLSPLHDSCVNNVEKPTIFVVFERSQAYPYYIIEYTT